MYVYIEYMLIYAGYKYMLVTAILVCRIFEPRIICEIGSNTQLSSIFSIMLYGLLCSMVYIANGYRTMGYCTAPSHRPH